MNSKVLFAAVFIAMLATTAAYGSPVAATSNPGSSSAPQRQMALTIPSSLTYDVNGTLIASINATGHVYITTNFALLHSFNITVKQLYVAVRISAQASDINFNATSGVGTATIDVIARLVVKVQLYVNGTWYNADIDRSTAIIHWPARWVVPWGSQKNFTIPFPTFTMDPKAPPSNAPDPLVIKFTDDNDTFYSGQYTVNHVQWDFSTWLQNRIQTELDAIWGNVMANVGQSIPGLQGGFSVVKSVGRVDLWKTSGTNPDNILLMAGGLIDLVIDWSLVGHGSASFKVGSTTYTATYDVDLFAELAVYFSITVTSDWQIKTSETGGNYTLNEFTVQIPENATLVWKKVGVIVYYGSPAHGIDVTGGVAYTSGTRFGGETMFFVDYGMDGTPDFATNGTGQPDQLTDLTGTITGTGSSRNVTLSKLTADGWVYFKLTVPAGYSPNAQDITVYRTDGGTRTQVNVTQYWTQYGVLYVCDDPAYTYTVELTSTGGAGVLPTSLILIGAVAVVALAGALVVLTRRKSSKGVSIK